MSDMKTLFRNTKDFAVKKLVSMTRTSLQAIIEAAPITIATQLRSSLKPNLKKDKIYRAQLANMQANKKITALTLPCAANERPLLAFKYQPYENDSNHAEKCLVYIHGNAGYAAEALYEAVNADNTQIQGYMSQFALTHHITCITIDYRGKGENQHGKETWADYSTLSDVRDQQKLIQYLLASGYKPENITVMGHSFGSMVAIWVMFDLIAQQIIQKLVINRLTQALRAQYKGPFQGIATKAATRTEIINTLQELANKKVEFKTMLHFYQACSNSFSKDMLIYVNRLIKQKVTCHEILDLMNEDNGKDFLAEKLIYKLEAFLERQPAYEKIDLISWCGFAHLRDFSSVYENSTAQFIEKYTGVKQGIKFNFFSLSRVFQEHDLIPKEFCIEDAAAFLPHCRMFRVKGDGVVPGDGPADLKEPSLVKTILARYPELQKEGRVMTLECGELSPSEDPHAAYASKMYFNSATKNLTGDILISSIALKRFIQTPFHQNLYPQHQKESHYYIEFDEYQEEVVRYIHFHNHKLAEKIGIDSLSEKPAKTFIEKIRGFFAISEVKNSTQQPARTEIDKAQL
ncbi:MAG: alpha/beta hydrolase family protein [Gammaproteobacteria bacterium]